MKAETHYINIDLDLEALEGLDGLVEALSVELFLLNPCQKHRASLEHRVGGKTPDETIRNIFESYSRLTAVDKTLWHGCTKRTLNIGIQAGLQPYQVGFVINETTQKCLEQMNVALVITVYGAAGSETA